MTDSSYLSFRLDNTFAQSFSEKHVEWGFPCGGGNSLGEITFVRSYSRQKPDGSKERWHEANRRVIEGMYSIQKDHIIARRMPWSEEQGQKSAQEGYERLHSMKWTPPGRGLFAMGSPLVNRLKNSAPLFNCGAALFPEDDPERWIDTVSWLMEASMLGIGVGLTLPIKTSMRIHGPRKRSPEKFVIDDSREGWCESMEHLLRAYLLGTTLKEFDYSLIRPLGAPLKTFGGTASGPEALMKLHARIESLLLPRIGDMVDSRVTADVANMTGDAVLAGATRRSAELLLGDPEDQEFIDLKNFERSPERAEYGWLSNNSVRAYAGMDYAKFIERTLDNGEPGYIYLDVAKSYGRIADGPKDDDTNIIGFNPCVEIPLNDRELCCLSTVHLNRAENKEDFLRTIKFAYLYAKSVLLLPTHWPETNTVMLRNQRIGLSLTGVADFVDRNGWHTLRRWMDEGYREVRHWDRIYSDWLAVRESVRVTTVKPEGSVSILSGASSGCHWKTTKSFIRRLRLTKTDPLVEICRRAGYKVEPAKFAEDSTVCVEFPIIDNQGLRDETEVSIFEKAALAADLQHWWADNGVSITVTYDPATESEDVERILHVYEGRLKSVSFNAIDTTKYEQLPIEGKFYSTIAEMQDKVQPLDRDLLYGVTADAVDSKFCTTDACELPKRGT